MAETQVHATHAHGSDFEPRTHIHAGTAGQLTGHPNPRETETWQSQSMLEQQSCQDPMSERAHLSMHGEPWYAWWMNHDQGRHPTWAFGLHTHTCPSTSEHTYEPRHVQTHTLDACETLITGLLVRLRMGTGDQKGQKVCRGQHFQLIPNLPIG